MGREIGAPRGMWRWGGAPRGGGPGCRTRAPAARPGYGAGPRGAAVPVVDLSAELLDLSRLATRPEALDEALQRGLRALHAVVPYDLAALYQLDGELLRVRAAEGPLARPAVRRHTLALARFPTIRRALASRQPIPLEHHDHAGDEGDPYDGVLDLPHGHSCMVVPLHAGDRPLGLITLDRSVCGVYTPEAVALAGVYGQLLSMALAFAEQAALLDRYRHRLKEQVADLEAELGDARDAVAALEASASPAMRAVVGQAKVAAGADVPLLLLGETGVGKEVFARAVHGWSPRAPAPFVKMNCAAIPENLVESELFGHVKGAFSGAAGARQGRFATANGGTLLLDELGEMSLPTQARLLRVLQEGTFEPVGSDRTVKVDVRVLAATHVDLPAAVRAGRFREDLYYRLAVFPLAIPPLRERREDVLPIARDWLAAAARRTRRGPWTLDPAAEAALLREPFPGNVRQLVNLLERATILRPAGALSPAELGLPAAPSQAAPSQAAPSPAATGGLPTLEENERRYLEALMEATAGRIYGPGGAAEKAGVPPSTLQSRLARRGLR